MKKIKSRTDLNSTCHISLKTSASKFKRSPLPRSTFNSSSNITKNLFISTKIVGETKKPNLFTKINKNKKDRCLISKASSLDK
jgi:hypothetical protein